jgi:branched-chain amino acid transport system ATP-binding protein
MTPVEGLVVADLSAGYGAMQVVSGVSLEVRPGEVFAMVGRNGAGKSTTLRAIAGLRSSPARGRVFVGGTDISRATPAEAFRAGLAFVPEGHRVFGALTVRENLRLGAFPWRRKRRRLLERDLDRVFALFPVLAEFADRPAGALSGGQQQMVAMGQALVADPLVLALDEPSSGLAPGVVEMIYGAIRRLADEGRAVLVVEQDVALALASADRACVLEQGRVVISGAAATLAADQRVGDVVRGVVELDVTDGGQAPPVR